MSVSIKRRILAGCLLALLAFSPRFQQTACWGLSGTEGASFLDIPVGGRPAALGGAYTSLASDAYAPIWNPAGLGFLQSTQLSTMHLSYLEGMSYEYLSFAHPLSGGQGLGAAVQFFRPGAISGTDASGNAIGDFNGFYSAYSLGYGRLLTSKLSIGATAKLIAAKISDVSAQAYAADLAGMYRLQDNLTLGAALANLGTPLTFLSQHDSLPLSLRAGGAYRPREYLSLSLEGLYARTGTPVMKAGAEWRLAQPAALRVGYKTDTLRGSSGLTGITVGAGLELWGQKFDYAWVPLGDLGNTQYFSLLFQFGRTGEKTP